MVMPEPTTIGWDEVARANVDLEERLFKLGIRLDYDSDGDTLVVTIGAGGPSIAKQALDDVYFMIDPSSHKFVGATILSFADDFLGKNKIIRKLFPGAVEVLSAGHLERTGSQAKSAKTLFDSAVPRG